MTPPVLPPEKPEERTNWWAQWVEHVRRREGAAQTRGADAHLLGEHLFVGCETHNQLERVSRAVGRKAEEDGAHFRDAIEYHEIVDLRSWTRSEPAPLLVHEKIFAEHCYVLGPSGSGKSSLGIMPLLIQLIRGAKTNGP